MATVNSTASSQVAYSYLQSKNKIGGLVSGMDIDSIMEKLMKAESAQMEKLQQQKQRYEWKRDAYREVNTQLNTFQQDLFDKYGLKSSWNSNTSNVSSNSAVNVKANAGANGNLTISEVTMATSAKSNFSSTSLLQNELIKSDTLIGNIDGFDTNILQSSDFKDASSLKDVIDVLGNKGYNATITTGKLTVSSKSDAQSLSTNDQEVLKALGVHFGGRKSDAITLKDDSNVIATGTTKLAELGFSSGEFNFKVIGSDEVTVSYDENDTLNSLSKKLKDNGLVMAINSKGEVSFKATNGSDLESINQPFGNLIETITSSDAQYTKDLGGLGTPKNAQSSNTIKELLGVNAQDGLFTLNAIQADGTMKETTITYKATETIDSLMKKINSSGAGVTAIFNNGKFSISANNTGDNSTGAEVQLLKTVKDESGQDVLNNSGGLELLGKLTGLSSSNPEPIDLATGGTGASMTVNGIKYEQSSNVFNIAGYEIAATGNLSNTEAAGATTKSITVSSTPDTNKTVDKVKEFVNTYNDLLKNLTAKTTEKRKVGYDALTDAQKAAMNDSEISKWEDAARAGLLKGDTTLNNVVSTMRQTIFNYGNSEGVDKATGIKGETLSSIGISTSNAWSDNGKLVIDETKLREAIEKDPDILSRIFTGDGTSENPGVASQLRKTAQDAIKTIEKSAGKESTIQNQYTLGKTIESLDTKISDWKTRLKAIEERYWNQFSAMETAIQKANSQSSIFAQG